MTWSLSSSVLSTSNRNTSSSGTFMRRAALCLPGKPSPFLSEGAEVQFKAPGLDWLLCKNENGFCYLRGFQKKFVRFIRHLLPGSLQIDNSVQYHVADMDLFRSEISRQRLGESPLA